MNFQIFIMASTSKLINLRKTLWRHKKKSIFAAVLSLYGASALNNRIKDDEIRRVYGEKARKFGNEPIAPTESLRRVTVLVNEEAGRRKAAKLFDKNALPLLNLAGLQVNVIKVKSQAEMEQIARVIDKKEADCLFLVGGDGTVCSALNGICQRNENEPMLPIGIFPGGQRNKTFAMLDFLRGNINIDPSSRAQLCCESAMALIEDSQKIFYPIKCTVNSLRNHESEEDLSTINKEDPSSTYWLLSEIAAGCRGGGRGGA